MRKLTGILVFGLMVAALAWSSGQTEAGAESGASGTITLYTSETSSDVEGYVRQFEMSNPGTTVEVFRLGTTELVARLLTELEAGDTPADVVWFADMALFEQMAADGQLLDIDPPQAANIPETYVYFDGMAYEARLIYQIIIYNTNLVDVPPTGWWDLTDPQYKGAVGSASPFVSGATVTQVATVVQDENLGLGFLRAACGQRSGCLRWKRRYCSGCSFGRIRDRTYDRFHGTITDGAGSSGRICLPGRGSRIRPDSDGRHGEYGQSGAGNPLCGLHVER
jgi:hypothetical protein